MTVFGHAPTTLLAFANVGVGITAHQALLWAVESGATTGRARIFRYPERIGVQIMLDQHDPRAVRAGRFERT